jgi:hypothetical protein
MPAALIRQPPEGRHRLCSTQAARRIKKRPPEQKQLAERWAALKAAVRKEGPQDWQRGAWCVISGGVEL